MKDQLRIVADKIDKKARGVTNSLAAYEGMFIAFYSALLVY